MYDDEFPDQPSDRDNEESPLGYKNPPTRTRFKKGQSGNPKGRPKGSSNPDKMLEKILNQKITIREGENIQEVKKIEAIMIQRVNKAIKGGFKESEAILRVLRSIEEDKPIERIFVEFVPSNYKEPET